MGRILSDIVFADTDHDLSIVANEPAGTVKPLSGHAIRVYLRTDPASSTNVKTWTTDDRVNVTDAANGEFDVQIQASNTASILTDINAYLQVEYHSDNDLNTKPSDREEFTFRIRRALS